MPQIDQNKWAKLIIVTDSQYHFNAIFIDERRNRDTLTNFSVISLYALLGRQNYLYLI